MQKNDEHNGTGTDNSSAFVKPPLCQQLCNYEQFLEGNMKSNKIKIT